MSIATNLKAQLVGQLIDAIGSLSASSATNSKAFAANAVAQSLATLGLGQTVQARINGPLSNGQLPLLILGTPVLAEFQANALAGKILSTGSVLSLRVEATGPVPRLSILPGNHTSGLAGASVIASDPSSKTPALTEAIRVQLVTSALDTSTAKASAPSVSALVAQAASQAAARQGSAAPLYANLAAVLGQPDNGLPPTVQRLAATLLQARLDGSTEIKPEALQRSFENSGVVFPSAAFENSRQQSLPHALDIKSLLLALRDSLPTQTADFKRTTPDQEPPRRDGPVAGHKAVSSTIYDLTDIKNTLPVLSRDAEQAHERLKLHQIASLPDAQHQRQDIRQLQFEVPIAFGTQTAIAAFRIEHERESHEQSGGSQAPQSRGAWGVRFAVDENQLGPVHAHVRLAGSTVSVSLWAEKATTHRFFVQSIPMLEAALADNALTVGEIAIFPGKPAENRTPAAGHFLDRRS